MHERIVELKRAIVRLEDHNDRLRWAMVMHTTINRIAAHQMQVLLGEDHWDATLTPYSTFLPRVATPAPHAVWSGALGACNRCSGNPVDTGNGHGPENHLHRQCTSAHPPPTRPATGTAVTIATVVPAVGTAAAARPHVSAATATAGPPAATFNAVATAAIASLTDAARPAVTTTTTASLADAARPVANTAATQPAAAINAVTTAIDQPPPPPHSAPPLPPSSPEPSWLTTPYNAAAAVTATADTTEAAAVDAAEAAAAPVRCRAATACTAHPHADPPAAGAVLLCAVAHHPRRLERHDARAPRQRPPRACRTSCQRLRLLMAHDSRGLERAHARPAWQWTLHPTSLRTLLLSCLRGHCCYPPPVAGTAVVIQD